MSAGEGRIGRLRRAHALMLAERWAWFAVGVFVNAFGIALITKAALGTSPISSVAYVLSLEFPFTLGMFTFVVNMLFILLQFALLRREFKVFQWLQIAVNVAFSAFIDVGMGLLSWFDPATLPEQAAALLLGCVILGVGVSVEVAPNVLMVPGEGAVRALSLATRRRFGSVKIAFDCSLVGVAIALSLLFFGRLNGVGAGTVVSAVLVGSVVNFSNRHIPLTGHIVNVRIRSERMGAALARERKRRGDECGAGACQEA